MKITKEELPVMARAYDIASCSLIVMDALMNIVCINHHAQKMLRIKRIDSWVGAPFYQLWDKLKLPPVLDNHFNLICPKIMVINKQYRVWRIIRVSIDNKPHWFLLDKDISEVNETYNTLEHEIKKITGHVFEQHVPVNQYIDEMRHFLTSMINRIPCYVYWKNKDLEYIGCNELATEFFNLKSPEEIVGKTDLDLFADKELAESYREADRRIIQYGLPILKLPQELVRGNGETFHTLVSKVPITSESGEIIGVLGITIDITKEKQAEIAKTEFIANMSHDIRIPLTGVIGLSELLENELEEPAHKKEAHMLYESGNQLLNMFNEILEDVRNGNANGIDIQKETFDVRQCINNLIKLEAPTVAAKNLDFSYHIDSSIPPHIISDRKKIYHILLNLIGNAVKFTKAGSITLTVTHLNTSGADVCLQFSVTDTGIGIPEELQDKIYERFFHANPYYDGIYKGYGLGLHMVRSYVTLLGGALSLKSAEGVGTTISFELTCGIGEAQLPSANQNEQTLNATSIDSSDYLSADENTLEILLVEDNAIALRVLESIVAKEGYHFTSATNGEQALELARTMAFDLIITDIGLSGVSGTELTERIRKWEQTTHRIPVIIFGLTGHDLETVRAECLCYGMNEVFRKPINPSMFKGMIEQLQRIKRPKPGSWELGFPYSEDELFALGSFELFDPKEGLKYTNDISLLFSALKTYISHAIQDDIQKMKQAYTEKNWKEIERITHYIKSGAAAIGIKRMHQACQYFERYHKAGYSLLLERLYHQVLIVNDDTINKVTHWLNKYTNI